MNALKKLFFILPVIMICLLASCKQKQVELSKKEIKFKADSIFIHGRLDELKRSAAEDFDRRQSIEVKGKADSIVDAYIKANPITPPLEE